MLIYTHITGHCNLYRTPSATVKIITYTRPKRCKRKQLLIPKRKLKSKLEFCTLLPQLTWQDLGLSNMFVFLGLLVFKTHINMSSQENLMILKIRYILSFSCHIGRFIEHFHHTINSIFFFYLCFWLKYALGIWLFSICLLYYVLVSWEKIFK